MKIKKVGRYCGREGILIPKSFLDNETEFLYMYVDKEVIYFILGNRGQCPRHFKKKKLTSLGGASKVTTIPSEFVHKTDLKLGEHVMLFKTDNGFILTKHYPVG